VGPFAFYQCDVLAFALQRRLGAPVTCDKNARSVFEQRAFNYRIVLGYKFVYINGFGIPPIPVTQVFISRAK